MFRNCTSLREAPYLPAVDLTTRCYKDMFSNCYALNSIKLAYTGSFNRNDYAFEDWHYNVSAAGTFYYNGSDTTRGTSAIPANWTIQTF